MLLHLFKLCVKLDKGFLAVIVVGVDDYERLVYNALAAVDCVTVTPGFHSVSGALKALGQAVKLLVYIVNVDLRLYSVADHTVERFTDILSDNENDLVKAGLLCVVYRIVHNYLAAGTEWFKLLDTAFETASETRCEND